MMVYVSYVCEKRVKQKPSRYFQKSRGQHLIGDNAHSQRQDLL